MKKNFSKIECLSLLIEMYMLMTKYRYIKKKLLAVTHRRNQMPPTKGMAPHSSPHTSANACLIQCNTSPS